jgi:hypothetical protein
VQFLVLIISSFLLVSNARALDIPKLNRADLSTAVDILGFNTSARLLSNPFPLGGYTGFEFGYSYEIVSTQDLSTLGTGTAARQSDFNLSRISIGKGLYNNIDVYVHFVPFSKSSQVSEFGGLVKWNFYQAAFVPFSMSMLFHGSTINIQDSFINQSLGADLLAGINVNNFALYFGGGQITAESRFMDRILNFCTGVGVPAGCDPSLPMPSSGANISPLNTTEHSSHSFVGINMQFMELFFAAQIDRYEDPVYSLKVGYRN